ncbi:MAG: hypothetical protein RLZZ401_1890 [Pseudomonadota bacterium]|jgi:1-acyl-sn-glycerol-3-phosphate acyltransferase
MQEVKPTLTDRGHLVARWALHLAGWKLVYRGTPAGCGVIIAYPHTSNWDFVVGVLAKWALGIPLAFLAKDSLFKVPILGRCIRQWGGLPVDRAHAQGLISRMADQMTAAARRGDRWWLAIAPEGTRKAQPGWRSAEGSYSPSVLQQSRACS